MLWLTSAPNLEISRCGRYRIQWRPAGFGIWVAEVLIAGKKVTEFVSSGQEDAGRKARAYCTDWGHLA